MITRATPCRIDQNQPGLVPQYARRCGEYSLRRVAGPMRYFAPHEGRRSADCRVCSNGYENRRAPLAVDTSKRKNCGFARCEALIRHASRRFVTRVSVPQEVHV